MHEVKIPPHPPSDPEPKKNPHEETINPSPNNAERRRQGNTNPHEEMKYVKYGILLVLTVVSGIAIMELGVWAVGFCEVLVLIAGLWPRINQLLGEDEDQNFSEVSRKEV